MDFSKALSAHQQWKTRLLRFLTDGQVDRLDPESLEREDACELGAWLNTEAKAAFAGTIAYQGLVEVHTAFHRCAAEVVRLHLAGHSEEASHILNDEFKALSSAISLAITRLRRDMEEA